MGGILRNWVPKAYAPASVGLSFKGVSQYDLRNMLGGSSYIPPDTMGAIGGDAVHGDHQRRLRDLQQVDRSTSVDAACRHVLEQCQFLTGGLKRGRPHPVRQDLAEVGSRCSSVPASRTFKIAVSTTSNAMGPWQSTKFTGFAGGVADYPTLAIDKAGVYIGTNNFGGSCGGTNYCGETLNVISGPTCSAPRRRPPTSSNSSRLIGRRNEASRSRA